MNIFENILDMSITASYVAVVVILIRFFIKKAPKSFSFALWIAVLFRLVCPVSFISDLSIFNFVGKASFKEVGGGFKNLTAYDMQVVQVANENVAVDKVVGDTYTVGKASYNSPNVAHGFDFMQIAEILWIIGMLALIVYFIVSYIKTYSRVKTATLYRENIYESDQIDTAFVFGIFRPKIYIPIGLTEHEKIYIIEHERVHLRRKDHLTKIISFLILVVHWFNPIMWMSFVLMTKDMEMSCDERVMKNLGEDIRVDYSHSLLNLAVNRSSAFSTPIAFSENNIKSRIKNILNYKKPGKWIVLIIALVVVVSTVFLISNPKDNALDNAESLIKNTKILHEQSENKYVLVKDIGDLTDFEWDYLYNFSPYTSKKDIEAAIGFESDEIKETVNELMNQVIFTKDKKIVCYIYGYPNEGVYFDFTNLYKDSTGYVKLSSKDGHKFLLREFDGYLKMSSILEIPPQKTEIYDTSGEKIEHDYTYDEILLSNDDIAVVKKNTSKEEIAKILFVENINFGKLYFHEGDSIISDYRIKDIRFKEDLGDDKFSVEVDFDLKMAEGFEKYHAGNGDIQGDGWCVDKYNIWDIERIDKDTYILTDIYTG